LQRRRQSEIRSPTLRHAVAYHLSHNHSVRLLAYMGKSHANFNISPLCLKRSSFITGFQKQTQSSAHTQGRKWSDRVPGQFVSVSDKMFIQIVLTGVSGYIKILSAC
jgi:hypothetical protein